MVSTKEVIECLNCRTRQWAIVENENHNCTGCKIDIPQKERVLCWTEEEMKLKDWLNDEG